MFFARPTLPPAARLLVILTLASTPAAHRSAPQRPPSDPLVMTVGSPVTVVSFDADERHGQPTQLLWSADAAELYLRLTRTDRWGNQTNRHFFIGLPAKALREITEAPEWAGTSWLEKSSLVAPADPDLHITVETREERIAATGDNPFSRASERPVSPEVSATLRHQTLRITTLSLRGRVLGRFRGAPPALGLTYGWGKAGSGLLAYCDDRRKLFLLDRDGRQREVPGVGAAWLPAWSPDLSRIAVLDQAAHKKYEVKVFTVCCTS